jgi:hypothetical protein
MNGYTWNIFFGLYIYIYIYNSMPGTFRAINYTNYFIAIVYYHAKLVLLEDKNVLQICKSAAGYVG